ncbi:MAG TPA: acylphosphatase [Armatimonadaceae bacterium]|nr:acylphosphatase [Armatimonadaceae bacterium]
MSLTTTVDRTTRLTALVHGRVQGVGYRFFAHHAANGLPIAGGFVRNLPDGTVEVQAEAADRAALEQLLRELHEGPTTAHVEGVDATWEAGVPPRFSGGALEVR